MILVLAGTAEGRAVASALHAEGRDAIASFAGVTRAPLQPDGPVRTGGFGGAEGFRRFLAQAGIRAVLDATHPFAARITARTARLCAEAGLPHAVLSRPAWRAGPGDRWHAVATPAEVAEVVPPGAAVFLAIGRQDLPHYAGLAGRRIVIRSIEPASAALFPGATVLTARPPWSVADETALLRAHRIDWIVTKNAGGTGARAKLDAARDLGLDVAMVDRPPLPPGARVLADVGAALDWLRALP